MTVEEIEELYKNYRPLLISLSLSACRKYSMVDYSDILSYLSLCFVEEAKKYSPERTRMDFPGYIKMALEKDSLDYIHKRLTLSSREIPSSFQSGNTDCYFNKDTSLEDESLLLVDGFEDRLVDSLYVQDLLEQLRKYSPEYANIIYDVYILGYRCSEPYITNKYGLSVSGAYNRVKAALRDLRRIAEKSERMEEKANRYNRFIYKKVSSSSAVGLSQGSESRKERSEEAGKAEGD